ncbi:hypothetical protein HPB52_020777 [Rhipicephalus sanguineus]|uniref:Uncharacterized protein n=1 Tax=Rhipicephalus sanguineus TaxID=34632 RepID=A0A9D4TBP1_RHISA|nr:hypothetical protein HPB52_020777 [Rhipicephalus sanguineus]
MGPQSVGSTYGPSFSLFGDRDELVSLDGRVRAALAKVSPPPACGDLLGSILEMQSVFHSKGGLSGAIVQRDGSLDLRAVPSTARKCPRSPPGSPAESPASPPPSSIGGHSAGSANQTPSRRASSGSGYTSGCVGASGDNGTTPSRHDDHAQREASVVDHDEEASSSENELVIDEQENPADVPEDEEVAGDHLKAAGESEEEGPILETANVRSPSPENDEGTSQVSDEEGGLEIVENGNSSDGEQGEDEVMEPKKAMVVREETGSAPVEDTPASPTEEEGPSFMQDAPASPPTEDSPSSPLEATPSPPTPVDAPASPTEDVVPGASPIESGEDSSAPVSPEAVQVDEQAAEVSREGEDGEENDEKVIADANEGDDEDTQDNTSSPKEIESPEAEPEEEEGEEQEESSLAAGGPGDDIASPAPEESKEADDGGVLGNLLDTEDISSSEEEGLLEDTSNGMEDISEPGSTDGLVDNLEAVVREQEEPWRQDQKDKERPLQKERKTKHKKDTCHHRKHRRHRRTNSNNEDREEGEIVEERSPLSSSRRRKEAETSADDLAELAPRINISELPRIPKLKRSDKAASHTADSESSLGGDSTSAAVASHAEVKRTSVLGRVDSGSDISWKKLSKHSRERSYRDGKQRDDTVLYKEREIKKREKKSRVERSDNPTRKDGDARTSSPSPPPPPKKKERRPDRELYVRPDKKHHRDKYKERDKHSSSGSSSKEHTRHSSKDRRRSSSKNATSTGTAVAIVETTRMSAHQRSPPSTRIHVEQMTESQDATMTGTLGTRGKSETREKLAALGKPGIQGTMAAEGESLEMQEIQGIGATADLKKNKVVVEKDYWRDKHERRKRGHPVLIWREAEEHTPIESKEVIAKGDSIIINVNFNRSKKETKVAATPSKDPDTHSKSSTRESRPRKREASSPATPQYGSDSDVNESLSKKRRRHHLIGHDGDRDESEASDQDNEQEAMERSPVSPAYDFGDQASASSPSVSDGFADNKPSTPPEVHPSPPSPGPSPPPPPMVAASTATETDPRPPPELELPPLPPEPEPPTRAVKATAVSLPLTQPVPSMTSCSTWRRLCHLHLARILPPPMGLLPLRPPPAPIVRLTARPLSLHLPAAPPTTLSLPPEPAARVTEQTEPVAVPPQTAPAAQKGSFDSLLPTDRKSGKGSSKSKRQHSSSSGGASQDAKHVIHFVVDKAKGGSSNVTRSRSESNFSSRSRDESQLQILDELPARLLRCRSRTR